MKLITGKLYFNKSNFDSIVFTRTNNGNCIASAIFLQPSDVLFYIRETECPLTYQKFHEFVFESKIIYLIYINGLRELFV